MGLLRATRRAVASIRRREKLSVVQRIVLVEVVQSGEAAGFEWRDATRWHASTVKSLVGRGLLESTVRDALGGTFLSGSATLWLVRPTALGRELARAI